MEKEKCGSLVIRKYPSFYGEGRREMDLGFFILTFPPPLPPAIPTVMGSKSSAMITLMVSELMMISF